MRLFAALVVALVALSLPAQAAGGGPKARSILVLELRGEASVVDHSTLTTITSTVAAAVSKRKGLNVLTAQDVKNLVDIEAQKQMLGCTSGSESCLAEVANAMGAELVLSGDVGKLGSAYVINLNLFDASKARSLGRENLTVNDLAQLPSLLESSIGSLLSPITGEQGLTSKTGGFSIPTVDTSALKSGGLKAINMQAENALELALDLQDDPHAAPEAKRDAWCSLANVPGSNAYLGPAQKACDEWTSYVVANDELQTSIAADYDTLSGFLKLKRKTNAQKLEAVDSFLKAYARLENRDEVKDVKEARRKVADGDDVVTLPARASVVAPDPSSNNGGEVNPVDGGSCLDGVGCLALNFDDKVHLGIVFGLQVPLILDYSKSADFKLAAPGFVFGGRVAWAFFEGGANLYFDPFNGPSNLPPAEDLDGNGLRDDANGNLNPDDDNDNEKDDVDDTPCGEGATAVPDCFIGSSSEPDRKAITAAHVYAGVQTFNITVEEVTFLRPSFGVDVYADGDGTDFGSYAANTFDVAGLMQLRVYVRSHIAGDTLVPNLSIGIDGSLDYLALFEE
ncbi:MAG: hypothetical protein Q8O67_20320 [Deltaproteobacteria bacterium]|nr:hypothetical protein [Deltaproteobacteria bacterium]